MTLLRLTPAERRLVASLDTPRKVQRWLQAIGYNKGVGRTLRSFRGVHRHKAAHCLEGALAAAFILERHGWPPLLLDLGSDDGLDHVNFLFRGPRGWGAVGKSRYPALMGRAPAYRTVRDLAWSYVDPFVDKTGRVNGYAAFDLRELGGTAGGRSRRGGGRDEGASSLDWALSERNVWRIEDALLENPHKRLRASDERHRRWKARYLAWKAEHPHEEPPRAFYPHAERMW